MKVEYDVVANMGQFVGRDGEIKQKYQNCGTVLLKDDGRLTMKLDILPLDKAWSGWFSLIAPTPRED